MSGRAKLFLTLFCLLAAAAIAACLADGFTGSALAQGNPFGAGRGGPAAAPPPPAPEGVIGWIMVKQAEFYRALSGLVRAAKADGSAVWALLGLSFLYGVFHAAGPGHGKAVISSYMIANDETWRRGVILSFASAMLQASVAVAVVGVAAALLGATAKVMSEAVRWIEIVSYALIAVLGAQLLWVKGRGLLSALRALHTPAPTLAFAGAGGTMPLQVHDHHHGHNHQHDHAHGHHAHGHDHQHHAHEHPAHGEPGHVHDEHCGHSHGPEPEMLAGPGGWQRGLSAVFAVGLRPCSGAILVLVFALAQGLFWAGVASSYMMGLGTAITVAAIATIAVGAKGLATRLAGSSASGGYGTLAVRGLEVAAAAVVLGFGVLLLLGYLASERLGMA